MNPETLIMTLLFWGAVLFIVYTYFGYPIIIFLLAQLKPEATYCTETFPSVTFLIAAYNEELVIPQKIENTLQLDYPRDKLQIIVAADGSSDKTAELVRNFSDRGVELSYIPERGGKMAAIVRAMPLTRGEIVIFSDANNMYESQAVRILVAPFCDSSIGLTTGAKLIIDDQRNLSSAEGLYWKYESWIKKNETILGTCTNSVGEIMAIRRELFIPPVEKIINDDHYMVLDMIHRGYRVVYTPQARSFEYVSQTAKDEIVRRVRMNAGLYPPVAMENHFSQIFSCLCTFCYANCFFLEFDLGPYA
ncbi:MAG: hypothetical protein AMJ53_16090 [Gammaproteobacteria bacterium SG8_11]|nr:MAG: hypothetical protein AMJ53_16090 [Gammaproteobacteria bacterium SG8_11]